MRPREILTRGEIHTLMKNYNGALYLLYSYIKIPNILRIRKMRTLVLGKNAGCIFLSYQNRIEGKSYTEDDLFQSPHPPIAGYYRGLFWEETRFFGGGFLALLIYFYFIYKKKNNPQNTTLKKSRFLPLFFMTYLLPTVDFYREI